MLQYSNEQLATIVGVPITTILLIWTVAIFHKNRKKWQPYDITIVAILILSILRNLAILSYTALIIAKNSQIPSDFCKPTVWFFNSVHTFQASSLTTLTVIALFTVKLYKKQQSLQQNLTPTHVIYHLFCLTTLCACVGVAAILAQEDNEKQHSVPFNAIHNEFAHNDMLCKFMPFELDIKYNIFIIVLHIFLAMVSLTSFICICFQHLKMRGHGFDYLKKSTSDLSELSLSLTASVANPNDVNKNCYDTYTIRRGSNLDNGFESSYEAQVKNLGQNTIYREPMWNSDLSNISMTVSSTNSKRPCLNKKVREREEENVCGLQTMYPTLTVCYLFNHLPLIVLCIFPGLVLPWPVSGVALWMGQLQDVLIPVGLGLVDSRFSKWVSKVYKCSERRQPVEKIPPGVGLDGKFRHFGSQPQSLETSQQVERIRAYNCSTEPKFPITNGSLYTSIDGRLPIIHNYRRHKDQRACPKTVATNSHTSHLKRQDYVRPRQDFICQPPNYPSCTECDQISSSQLNLYQSRPTGIPNPSVRRIESFSNSSMCHNLQQSDLRSSKQLQKRISLSQDSLCRAPVIENVFSIPSKSEIKRSKVLKGRSDEFRVNNRISKSEDCLNDLQADLQKFKQNPEIFQKNINNLRASQRSKDVYVSSDDDYFTDTTNINDTMVDYDCTSQSSYSITTEANGDFDFYQNSFIDDEPTNKNNETSKPDKNRIIISVPNSDSYEPINTSRNDFATFQTPQNTNHFTEAILARCDVRNSKNSDLNNVIKNFRITRSNSKRSLENFQAYIDVDYKLPRSNSFASLENRKKSIDNIDKFDYRLPNNSLSKTNLGNIELNAKNLYRSMNKNETHLIDMYNRNLHNQIVYNYDNKSQYKSKLPYHSGSVPDFKKVFISEYI